MSDELTGMAVVPRWLQRDPSVSGHAKLVYLAINSRMGEHGAAFPSHAVIAEDCGLSKSAVIRAIKELELLGVLIKQHRFQDRNGQTSNMYTLLMHKPNPTPSQEDTPSQGDKGGVSDRQGGGVSLNHEGFNTKDSTEERSKDLSIKKPEIDLTMEFDQFWKVYPIRVGKGTAVTAFAKARKKAPLAEILAGAERYRNDPNRTDGYTKHPSTWLNSQGWLDEALPSKVPSATIPAGQAAPKSRTDEHLDMVAYYARLETQNQLPGIES